MSNQQSVVVVLIAGGVGSRMQSDIPKQFLLLNNKPIARHSFDIFVSMPEVMEIVVVCSKEYQHLFTLPEGGVPKLTFALPGARRQDSIYNGFKAITTHPHIVCTHDSARPFITASMVKRVLAAAYEHGAATTGMPVKFTIKECDAQKVVTRTPDRAYLWEIQTPQATRADWFQRGFDEVLAKDISVTDDVAVVECIGLPVHLVEGSYRNLKITTPEDLLYAEMLVT